MLTDSYLNEIHWVNGISFSLDSLLFMICLDMCGLIHCMMQYVFRYTLTGRVVEVETNGLEMYANFELLNTSILIWRTGNGAKTN